MTTAAKPRARVATGPARCRRKFLRFFPGGFEDETYLDWERNYKWQAHERWNKTLDSGTYQSVLKAERRPCAATSATCVRAK